MKKLIVLLSVIMILTTGCSFHRLSNVDLGSNMKAILSDKTQLANIYFEGSIEKLVKELVSENIFNEDIPNYSKRLSNSCKRRL